MRPPSLEDRVTALEQRVSALQAVVEAGVRLKDWRRTVGMFAGDEVMKQIDAAALRYREADRKKARSRRAGTRRAKP